MKSTKAAEKFKRKDDLVAHMRTVHNSQFREDYDQWPADSDPFITKLDLDDIHDHLHEISR